MVIISGVVTGRKQGMPNQKGRLFHTLRVESGGKVYYPKYEEGTLPGLRKGQPITLICNVNARNNYLNLFVAAKVSDDMILNPEDFLSEASAGFDDFE